MLIRKNLIKIHNFGVVKQSSIKTFSTGRGVRLDLRLPRSDAENCWKTDVRGPGGPLNGSHSRSINFICKNRTCLSHFLTFGSQSESCGIIFSTFWFFTIIPPWIGPFAACFLGRLGWACLTLPAWTTYKFSELCIASAFGWTCAALK